MEFDPPLKSVDEKDSRADILEAVAFFASMAGFGALAILLVDRDHVDLIAMISDVTGFVPHRYLIDAVVTISCLTAMFTVPKLARLLRLKR